MSVPVETLISRLALDIYHIFFAAPAQKEAKLNEHIKASVPNVKIMSQCH